MNLLMRDAIKHMESIPCEYIEHLIQTYTIAPYSELIEFVENGLSWFEVDEEDEYEVEALCFVRCPEWVARRLLGVGERVHFVYGYWIWSRTTYGQLWECDSCMIEAFKEVQS